MLIPINFLRIIMKIFDTTILFQISEEVKKVIRLKQILVFNNINNNICLIK